MPAKNRMSISLSDEELTVLDRAANRMQRSRSEVIRKCIREYIEKHPEAFDLLAVNKPEFPWNEGNFDVSGGKSVGLFDEEKFHQKDD